MIFIVLLNSIAEYKWCKK